MKYFVSYFYSSKGTTGLGCNVIEASAPLDSMDKLDHIMTKLRENGGFTQIAIINWRRMELPE